MSLYYTSVSFSLLLLKETESLISFKIENFIINSI